MNDLDVSAVGDGLACQQLFSQGTGLTFDDVSLLPPFCAGVPNRIVLETFLARDFPLHCPFVSSPMDTVTEWKTAVHMALSGGIGIIHFNLTPEDAAAQVRRVKRFRMGFIFEPLCRKPSDPMSEVDRVKTDHGFSTILITENGTPRTKLLGMVTKGHVALEQDKTRPLQDVMIPLRLLRTCLATDVRSLRDAREILRQEPALSKLPIMNTNGSVHALTTRDDVVKGGEYPCSLLDANEQLRVGAAVSTQEEDALRVDLLLEAGVDVLVVDSAQGGTDYAVRRIQEIKRKRENLPVIAGNVVTPAQAKPLVDAGADGLRVGMGSGSICTTQDVVGAGRAQLSAVYHLSRFARTCMSPIPIISDGGIRRTADIVKALACGASTVMLGRFIAGCEETPGDEVRDAQERRWKRYRGMGSPGAIRDGGLRRYGRSAPDGQLVAQGVEGWVPAEGSLDRRLPETANELRKALETYGCASIEELHERVRVGDIRFELRSPAAREEGHPHDIVFRPFSASWVS